MITPSHPPPTHVRPIAAGAALADIQVTPWPRDFFDTKLGAEMLTLVPGQTRARHHDHHLLHSEKPAPTLCHDFLGWFHTWHWARRPLRLAEWAALHGFPDSFTWTGNETKCCPMIGNAVPPPMATWRPTASASLLGAIPRA